MTILSIDTCMAACSASLCSSTDFEPLATRRALMQSGHAEALPGMIEAVCAEAGRPLNSVDSLAVTVGPGSFTGVRIGIAMARGLALALAVPIAGFTSLALIAEGTRRHHREWIEADPVIVVSDARRGAFYAEYFKAGAIESDTGPVLLKQDDAATWCPDAHALVAGTGAAAFIEAVGTKRSKLTLSDADPLPDATYLGHLALEKGWSRTMPEPLYLRPPDAKPQAPLIAIDHG